MSHFVSSQSDKDFEQLNQQLLRREPVDHDAEEAEEAVEETTHATISQEGPSSLSQSFDADQQGTIRQQGSSSASAAASPPLPHGLAARRRPDLSVPSSGAASPASGPVQSTSQRHLANSTRSPSYSRTNSPERIERPRSPSHLKPKSLRDSHRKSGLVGDPSDSVAELSESQEESEVDEAYHQSELQKTPRPDGPRSRKSAGPSSRAAKNVAFSESSPQRRDADVGRYAYNGESAETPLLEVRLPANRIKNTGMIDQNRIPRKLGTWDGVFVPVTLNILGVILFLRFGFIMGQAGLLGSLGLLIVSYAIDALTSMSISAISTNGVVRAGGIFYLASRSLGPEFGGATGLLFWLGQSLNASLNALGFVETLTDAFGQSRDGNTDTGLPEGPWWSFAYGSLVLLMSTIICLVGSRLFVKATMVLAMILAVAIASIPISSILVAPYADEERGIFYTGWSLDTLRNNLFPHFTSGAAGSGSPEEVKETWSSVFGVLFPAVTGVLAGASMSGDLRKPSKSIPKGTNWSLLCTFLIYAVVFVILAGTTARTSFYLDIGVMGDISYMPFLITIGALASTAFSALMGVQACGKVLQAIARDHLLPALDVFAQGTEVADTPTYGIVATYVFCQLALFVDSVNIIAQLVTMTSLLCFAVLSFACLALKAGGAPSFRPSFPYFNMYTAAAGTVASLVAMFFTDSTAASGCILLAILLFGAIHVLSPPKPWGDVTRNIHYWLTRKYLLRLDERKTNLKHWRPQVLLLANNPRSEWNLIIFCNSLKKGGLYVLGHCIKGDFAECLAELRKQQIAWLKLVDLSGIKSFVDVVIANDERAGARSLILSAGLGGMRPNIVVLGFPRDLQAHARANTAQNAKGVKRDESEITIRGPHAANAGPAGPAPDIEHLPTDSTRRESPITSQAYVGIIEDALALNKAVAVAYGFDMMQLPGPSSTARYEKTKEKQYIDLWPIQIASPDSEPEHAWDTYTMVLQLGTILSLTGTWKSHQLRVSVFVEEPTELEEERKRVRSLLDNLRIAASLRVFCLSDGSVTTYEAIVAGKTPTPPHIEEALKGDPWWNTLKELRKEDEMRAKAAAAKRRSEMMQQQAAATAIPGSSAGGATSAEASRRSKREQKLLGYSLPPEHMEYFQRNIRIGLSHPRAKPRVDDSDVEDDDSGSDSDDSGLSDELLRLGEDEFFGAGSSGTGLYRAKTYSADYSKRRGGEPGRRNRSYSHGGQAGLPDEPVRRRPGAAERKDSLLGTPTPSSSYGSMSATPIVRPDGTVVTHRAERSQDSTLKASERSKMQSGLRQMHTSLSEEPQSDSSMDDSAAVRGGGAGVGSKRARRRCYSEHERQPSPPPSPSPSRAPSTARLNAVPSATPRLTFNTLPNKAQFLILNELFRAHSSSSATSVILTSLPAPQPGTASRADKPREQGGDDGVGVERYLGQLEVLCAGSTPVLGIHARELTLSMSL